MKIVADRPAQRQELLATLTVMADNDPYLSYQLNAFNDDIYITLFGYVQMEIVQETLKRDYGIATQMTDPMTICMETPVGTGEAAVTMYEEGLPDYRAHRAHGPRHGGLETDEGDDRRAGHGRRDLYDHGDHPG